MFLDFPPPHHEQAIHLSVSPSSIFESGRTYTLLNKEVNSCHSFLTSIPELESSQSTNPGNKQKNVFDIPLIDLYDDQSRLIIEHLCFPVELVQEFCNKQRINLNLNFCSEPEENLQSAINQYFNENLAIKYQLLQYLFEDLFEDRMASLKHLNHFNPPLFILLSGTFGMGKTHLSKELEQHFQAIRVSSDEVRLLLYKKGFIPHSEDIRATVQLYLFYCINRLHVEAQNHTIILDMTCNAYNYKTCANFSEKQDYKIYFIRLIVSRDIVEERIKKREKSEQNIRWFLEQLPVSWKNYEKGKNLPFDYLLDNNKEGPLPDSLIEAIEKIKNP